MGVFAFSERLQGARIGAYEIVRPIGQGSSASVFEARHVRLGKAVAIKVLHEHLASDPQVSGRFLREGRVAAKLRHPNALDVMDLGSENGVAYLVMALLDGHDLKHHLAERGVLPLEEALAIVLPIASALAYAHDLGALHRDLKPANVFLSRDARGTLVPVLVDFGLSTLAGSSDAKHLSGNDVVAGTLAYMAPEQTFGVARAGAASDQFALATILYECVTGELPFSGSEIVDLIERIRTAPVRPPSLLTLTLPAEFDDVVMRALARDATKRWPSMRAFASALLPFADDETQRVWRADFTEPRAFTARSAAPPAESGARVRAAEDSSTLVPDGPTSARVLRERIPPLPMPAGSSPFHMKGMAYRGIALLAGRLFPGGIGELAQLVGDPSLVAFVDQPFLASGRYDVLPMLPLHAAAAQLLGTSLGELAARTAAAQCRYDARTVFQRMLGAISLRDWPSCFRRFGAQYYDFGVFGGETLGEGAVILRQTAVPEYIEPWFAPTQAAYGAETASLLGGRSITTELLPTVPDGTERGLPVVRVSAIVRWSEPSPSSVR